MHARVCHTMKNAQLIGKNLDLLVSAKNAMPNDGKTIRKYFVRIFVLTACLCPAIGCTRPHAECAMIQQRSSMRSSLDMEIALAFAQAVAKHFQEDVDQDYPDDPWFFEEDYEEDSSLVRAQIFVLGLTTMMRGEDHAGDWVVQLSTSQGVLATWRPWEYLLGLPVSTRVNLGDNLVGDPAMGMPSHGIPRVDPALLEGEDYLQFDLFRYPLSPSDKPKEEVSMPREVSLPRSILGSDKHLLRLVVRCPRIYHWNE